MAQDDVLDLLQIIKHWVTYDYIARKTNMNRTTICNNVKRLRQRGLIDTGFLYHGLTSPLSIVRFKFVSKFKEEHNKDHFY